MNLRFPASLKVTVPLILLVFAATLSTVSILYHAPRAERTAEEDSRKRLAQEMSRLQSTLEYLLLKGDVPVAQHEIEVLAHNHDVILAALTDDRQTVVVATRRAWLGRPIAEVLPQFDVAEATGAIRERRAFREHDHGVRLCPSDGLQRLVELRARSEGRLREGHVDELDPERLRDGLGGVQLRLLPRMVRV